MKTHLDNSKERKHFLVNKSSLQDLKLQAVYTGTFSTQNTVKQSLHKHNFCEIMLITGGNGTVFINDKAYKVTKGDLVVYPPKVPHSEIAEKSDNLLSIFFAIKYTRSSLSNFEQPDFLPVVNTENCYTKFENLFRLMIAESEANSEPYSNEVLNCICRTIFFEILNFTDTPLTVGKVSETFDILKNYIDEHYFEDFKINEICDTLALNKFYVSKLFKAYLGIPPVRYVIEKRIEASKKLLTSTNMSINEIASSVGYGDTYHFSRLFKKEVGVSPKNFRQNAAKTD